MEQTQSRFSSTASLAELCDCLVKGTYDPRVVGLVVKIDPLQCGWAKLQVRGLEAHEYYSSAPYCCGCWYYLFAASAICFVPTPAQGRCRPAAAAVPVLPALASRERRRLAGLPGTVY